MLRAARDINVNDQISRMQSQISSLTSQLGGFIDRERGHAGTVANRLVDTLNSKVSDYSGQFGDLADSASERMDGLQKFLTVEVKHRPLRTLAIAGVIGILLGAMSRGR